eukprot:c19846_g1_i1.p1 GENE.c19846_g1_i1~~c19846_g1_i1.p1  ORF type:complete len:931 (-),score=205.05 c19846_g1_i1:159-2951(-)
MGECAGLTSRVRLLEDQNQQSKELIESSRRSRCVEVSDGSSDEIILGQRQKIEKLELEISDLRLRLAESASKTPSRFDQVSGESRISPSGASLSSDSSPISPSLSIRDLTLRNELLRNELNSTRAELADTQEKLLASGVAAVEARKQCVESQNREKAVRLQTDTALVALKRQYGAKLAEANTRIEELQAQIASAQVPQEVEAKLTQLAEERDAFEKKCTKVKERLGEQMRANKLIQEDMQLMQRQHETQMRESRSATKADEYEQRYAELLANSQGYEAAISLAEGAALVGENVAKTAQTVFDVLQSASDSLHVSGLGAVQQRQLQDQLVELTSKIQFLEQQVRNAELRRSSVACVTPTKHANPDLRALSLQSPWKDGTAVEWASPSIAKRFMPSTQLNHRLSELDSEKQLEMQREQAQRLKEQLDHMIARQEETDNFEQQERQLLESRVLELEEQIAESELQLSAQQSTIDNLAAELFQLRRKQEPFEAGIDAEEQEISDEMNVSNAETDEQSEDAQDGWMPDSAAPATIDTSKDFSALVAALRQREEDLAKSDQLISELENELSVMDENQAALAAENERLRHSLEVTARQLQQTLEQSDGEASEGNPLSDAEDDSTGKPSPIRDQLNELELTVKDESPMVPSPTADVIQELMQEIALGKAREEQLLEQYARLQQKSLEMSEHNATRLSGITEHLESTQEQLKLAQRRICELEASAQLTQSDREGLVARITELTTQLSDAKEMILDLTDQCGHFEAIRQELAAKRIAFEEASLECSELSNKCRQLAAQVKELNGQFKLLQCAHHSALSEVRSHAARAQKAEVRAAVAESECTLLQNKVALVLSLSDHIDDKELMNKVILLEQSNAGLEQRLQFQQRDFEDRVANLEDLLTRTTDKFTAVSEKNACILEELVSTSDRCSRFQSMCTCRLRH